MSNVDVLVNLLITLMGQAMGQVIITPLPPEWLEGTPPPEPETPEKPELQCPEGWPGGDCIA